MAGCAGLTDTGAGPTTGTGGTGPITLAIGHFAVPFFLLMSEHAKRRRAVLAAGAVWMLLMHLLDMYWLVMPGFLEHGPEPTGWGVAGWIRDLLHAAEFNRFDCFPSGHTMLTLVTLGLAWRHAPRLLWVLAPVGLALIVSTVALRYHYAVDVLAGALLAPLSLWLARRAA